jgi:hypothetical protein
MEEVAIEIRSFQVKPSQIEEGEGEPVQRPGNKARRACNGSLKPMSNRGSGEPNKVISIGPGLAVNMV